ncbi:hypothetical protein ABMC65_000232 [Campylobacter jejuni]
MIKISLTLLFYISLQNLLTQSLNTNKDLQDFIDSLAKEDLIDSRAKFKL